jgi:hypothetical protein
VVFPFSGDEKRAKLNTLYHDALSVVASALEVLESACPLLKKTLWTFPGGELIVVRATSSHPFVLGAIWSVASTQIENRHTDSKARLEKLQRGKGNIFVATADNMSGSGGFRRLNCECGLL